jgi:hypothetical protein
MLRLEIGFPEFYLLKPLFYAGRGVGIVAGHVEKLCSDFVKFETFAMLECIDMMLL